MTPKQEERLREMCMEERSNMEIASELGIPLVKVHQWRSRNNLTVDKVKAIKKDRKDAYSLARYVCRVLDSEEICKHCKHREHAEDCYGLTACADALAEIMLSEVDKLEEKETAPAE